MVEKIIYQAGNTGTGTVWIRKKESRLPLLGRFLMITSLVLVLLLVAPYVWLEARWRLGQLIQKQPEVVEMSGFAKIIQMSDLQILQPVDSHFSIVIPKIGVNSAVLANVPVNNETEYQAALKTGIAHAQGSYLPGENGSIYLFGHSTNYLWNVSQLNALFYLLKELETGDQVNLFYDGQRYIYEVFAKKVVNAQDVDYLVAQGGKELVILQTCWPPGTTWKRLVILANPGGKDLTRSVI